MSFDSIPEDSCESYSCPQCRTGNVTQNIVSGILECDCCDWCSDDDMEDNEPHQPKGSDDARN